MAQSKFCMDWEFNTLGVYNFNKDGPKSEYFRHLFENDDIPGDICEVGVFRGSSLISTALYLKKIGSNKLVWGFDSFKGFPQYHEFDDPKYFKILCDEGRITQEHYEQFLKTQKYLAITGGEKKNVSELSSSGDFSETSKELIQRKLDFLELDNVRLVEGNFSDTMTKNSAEFENIKFSACLIDCDIYLSYKTSLPFVWERLSPGGYMVLDEYYSLKFPGAKIACDEFFSDKENKPRRHLQKSCDFERWFVRKF